MKNSVVILGAGLSGLSCAYHFQKAGYQDFLILEKGNRVGGLARTETFDGFSFDHSIHILYTKDPYARELIKDLLLGNFNAQARESYCYTEGIFTEYPYQTNQYGLPVEIVAENILGLILSRDELRQAHPQHFEAWIIKTFGKGIAERFMIPYNRKQWAWDLKSMSYDWIAERVPLPDMREVLLGALKKNEMKFGPNREFWYPKQGGIEALAQAFLKSLPAENILFNLAAISLDAKRRELVCANGKRIEYEHLVSTVPVPSIIRMLGKEVPEEIQTCAKDLKSNRVHTVNIGLQGRGLGVDRLMHWVYVPNPEMLFHRLSFPGNFSDWMTPKGCSSIQIEISESIYKPVDKNTLIQEVLKGLVKMKILSADEARPVAQGGRILITQVLTLDPAYIIYDTAWHSNMQRIKHYLESLNIQSAGRFGEWEYFNMDHAILSGKKAAQNIFRSSCLGKVNPP